MEEKIERSEELHDRIIKDEKLLRDLSETISRIQRGKVKLEDEIKQSHPSYFLCT